MCVAKLGCPRTVAVHTFPEPGRVAADQGLKGGSLGSHLGATLSSVMGEKQNIM